MPRLPPRLIRQAGQKSPNLSQLILTCRDLQSAQNELRWITEHVNTNFTKAQQPGRLASFCLQRRRGAPLQYILGSQPFGPLEIKCRRGVLIPRSETEAYTYHLASLIKSDLPKGSRGDQLNVIDFCSGTGCIPLLMYVLLQKKYANLNVRGVDVAEEAVNLARDNITYNMNLGNLSRPAPGQTLSITKADIFDDQDVSVLADTPCDVLISNPPYVSRQVWNQGLGQLGYSVRKYEPSLALVPTDQVPLPAGWQHADAFYARLLDLALLMRVKIALFEIGDEAQARRVLEGLQRHRLAEMVSAELWRDWPEGAEMEQSYLDVKTSHGTVRVPIKGSGQIRSIFLRLNKT